MKKTVIVILCLALAAALSFAQTVGRTKIEGPTGALVDPMPKSGATITVTSLPSVTANVATMPTVSVVVRDTSGNDLELVKQNDVWNAAIHGIPIFATMDTGTGPVRYIGIRAHDDGSLLSHSLSSADVIVNPATEDTLAQLLSRLTGSTLTAGISSAPTLTFKITDGAGSGVNASVISFTGAGGASASQNGMVTRAFGMIYDQTSSKWNPMYSGSTSSFYLGVELQTSTKSIGSVTANLPYSAASNTINATVSLGNTQKTLMNKIGSVVTTAVTQTLVTGATYSPTAGTFWYVQSISAGVRLTTQNSTTTWFFGTVDIQSPAGTNIYQIPLVGIGGQNFVLGDFAEPLPISRANGLKCMVTPAYVTSMTWYCNITGYEK